YDAPTSPGQARPVTDPPRPQAGSQPPGHASPRRPHPPPPPPPPPPWFATGSFLRPVSRGTVRSPNDAGMCRAVYSIAEIRPSSRSFCSSSAGRLSFFALSPPSHLLCNPSRPPFPPLGAQNLPPAAGASPPPSPPPPLLSL